MFQSEGALKTTTVVWSGTTKDWLGRLSSSSPYALSYSEMYKRQVWVSAAVNKLARGEARLPLKVYEKTGDADADRQDARESAYGKLLARPHPRLSPFKWWEWVVSHKNIYGNAILLKVRDAGGRPVELHPMHWTRVTQYWRDGELLYDFQLDSMRITKVRPEDVVHFRTFHPDDMYAGLSPLEPLRATLENEWAARTATSAFWVNGARPAIVLSHPMNLSDEAATRIKRRWDELKGGAHNTGQSVVLEEGLTVSKMSLTAEEAQYIETRKINREEVCGEFDIPPPVLHILDHATYSNINEQMRSMYRDTMAPRLKDDEDTLAFQLRDGRQQGRTEPDFGDAFYSEFDLNGVLRGDFEQRMQSYAVGIGIGVLRPSEARERENLEFVEGSDTLFIGGNLRPMDQALEPPEPPASPVVTPADQPPARLPLQVVRGMMGKLGRLEFKDLSYEMAEALPAEVQVVWCWALDGANSMGDVKQRLRLAVQKELT